MTHRSEYLSKKHSLARPPALNVCLQLGNYAKPRGKSSSMKRRAAVASLLASARALTRHLSQSRFNTHRLPHPPQTRAASFNVSIRSDSAVPIPPLLGTRAPNNSR